jgi:hypothetical protein
MSGELSPAERFGRLEGDRDDHEDRLRTLELWQTELKTVVTLLRSTWWPSTHERRLEHRGSRLTPRVPYEGSDGELALHRAPWRQVSSW